MPDEWDKENLQALIKNFTKEKFRECQVYDMDCTADTCTHARTITGAQWIVLSMAASRRDAQLEADSITTNPYGLKNKESDSRLVTSLPTALYARIGDTMPTIFRDKSHMEWFIKNFKYFLIPSKY